MLAISQRKFWNRFFRIAEVVITGLVVGVGASLHTVPSAMGPFEGLLEWSQRHAWIVVTVGPLLIWLAEGFRMWLGNPWPWEAVQNLLDSYCAHVFSDEEGGGDPLDHHRVTLFRFHRWLPCCAFDRRRARDWHRWRSWLVACARSGHLTKDRIAKFWTPDKGDHCEGVAGMAWRRKSWVHVPKNGEVLPDPSDLDDDKVRRYAKATGVSCETVRAQIAKDGTPALSFAALTVRLGGKPWGVLVIDSRSPKAIDSNGWEAFGVTLTPLLERT